MDALDGLANLLKQRRVIDDHIARVIGRSAEKGHVGEFIASHVFDIRLNPSASAKDIDGHFNSGPLANRTVNIKYYTLNEYVVDLKEAAQCDYYLVLTGPAMSSATASGANRPWVITFAYLFDGPALVNDLISRRVKVGVASSVRKRLWEPAEIYPRSSSPLLVLDSEQIRLLRLSAP